VKKIPGICALPCIQAEFQMHWWDLEISYTRCVGNHKEQADYYIHFNGIILNNEYFLTVYVS